MTSARESENKNLSPDLYTILRDILLNLWLVVLAFGIGVMGTYVILRQTYSPTYTSSVTLIIRSQAGTVSNYGNLSASMELAEVYGAVLTQPTTLEYAARSLGADSFHGRISTETIESTNILFVRVTDDNPSGAFRELSAVLRVYPEITDAINVHGVVDILEEPAVPKRPDNPFAWKDTGMRAGLALAALTLCAVALTHERSGKSLSAPLSTQNGV